jgi:dihydropteroate synthase
MTVRVVHSPSYPCLQSCSKGGRAVTITLAVTSRISSVRALFRDLGQRTQIMGILNITPDSFFDGGQLATPDDALDRALAMMDAGADLIDVGGESTRPGAEEVSAEVEMSRVLPVIERLAAKGVGPISIDTTKAIVASRAIDAGAKIVNDISGFTFDPDMARVVAEKKSLAVLMHTRAAPKVMQTGALEYEGGVVHAVRASLEGSVARAIAAGCAKEALIVDPGIGFGKTVEQNVELIRRLRELAVIGCPILVGPSRKSFLGKLTGRDVGQRLYATASSVALAIANGADFVRVHDVEAIGDVVRVADAVVRSRNS